MKLNKALQVASETPELDIAVQPLNLSRKAKRLVVLDVDSTLIQNEVIDLLAEQAVVMRRGFKYHRVGDER